MANFDKAVPPGGEGKITLKVDTKGYQGTLRKSARVKTNDPENQNMVLAIKATVKVPIYVSTRYVNLFGKGDREVGKTVKIRAELDNPLNLTVADFTLENKVKYAITTVLKGKEYSIQFTSLPKVKENFSGILKLQTNYPEKPEITIVVHGRFEPAEKPGDPKPQSIKKGTSSRDTNLINAPIYVSSRYIRLYGKEEVETSKIAEVRAEQNKPLDLTIDDFTLKDKLKYTIETIEKGKKYRIKFTTIPGVGRNYNGILKLKTNYPEMPAITFVIHGRFTKKTDNAR